MAEIDLDELAEMAGKATKGPYYILAPKKTGLGDAGDRAIMAGVRMQIAEVFERTADGSPNGLYLPSEDNAAYIAACSPERILALINCVRAAKEYVALFHDPDAAGLGALRASLTVFTRSRVGG